MDVGRVNDLVLHSREAYDAEIANDWTRAYELHERAIQQWKDLAGSAARFFPDMTES